MRSEIDVVTPRDINEALDLLHQDPAGMRVVAGGSDVIVQLRDGVIKTKKLLNLLSLKELMYVKQSSGQIHIGSLTTYGVIINSSLTQQHAWILVDAAKLIGAVQLQNTATIGGNLGNASPAGDSLPPLYALGATVVVRSRAGRREIPIEDFFVGYRKTALRPDELIEEIYFDALNQSDRGAYLKLGLREANAISIVDVAVALRGRRKDGSFTDAKLALGAVAPTIRRARECEQALVDRELTTEVLRDASSLAPKAASPITDIRGSADYRKEVVVSCVYQALHEAIFGRRKVNE
jgi:xanthine dehydrogenase FAD-binding subunit